MAPEPDARNVSSRATRQSMVRFLSQPEPCLTGRHVLVVPSWYPTRASPVRGTFFRDQALALEQAGCKVGVIVPELLPLRKLFSAEARPEVLGDRIPTLAGVGWKWLPATRSPRLDAIRSELLWAHIGRRLFRRYVASFGRPDLLHAHSVLHAGAVARSLKQAFGIPYVVTEHRSHFTLGKVVDQKLALARRVFEDADARIVVSPSLGAVLEERVGRAASPWHWIPNVVPPEFTGALPPSSDTPGFSFLNVGSLSEIKGQRDLILAFARAFPDDREVTLRIVGDGPLRSALRELAAETGVADRIAFPGRLDRTQTREEMLACDAFVLPSRNETFGVVLLEALSCGKPLVATRCGGPQCIITPENGLLVPVGSVPELCEALRRMRREKGHFDPATLRRTCLERFGPEVVSRQLLEVYAQLGS